MKGFVKCPWIGLLVNHTFLFESISACRESSTMRTGKRPWFMSRGKEQSRGQLLTASKFSVTLTHTNSPLTSKHAM